MSVCLDCALKVASEYTSYVNKFFRIIELGDWAKISSYLSQLLREHESEEISEYVIRHIPVALELEISAINITITALKELLDDALEYDYEMLDVKSLSEGNEALCCKLVNDVKCHHRNMLRILADTLKSKV